MHGYQSTGSHFSLLSRTDKITDECGFVTTTFDYQELRLIYQPNVNDYYTKQDVLPVFIFLLNLHFFVIFCILL